MFNRALKAWTNGAAVATAAALALALAPPTSAQAQLRIEIAPVLGAYMPTRPTDETFYACGSYDVRLPCQPDPSYQQTGGMAVGGRVTAWFSNRGAIEGSFWYAPSRVTDVAPYTDGFVGEEVAGHIVVADLRLVLSPVPQTSVVSVLLMGGPAVIHRSGDVRAVGSTSGTVAGGVLGVGLDIHLGRRFAMRAELDDYLYTFRFPEAEAGVIGMLKFRHDLVLSLSMGPSLFGQRGERR
jgi:hypothetical protein